MNTTTAILLAYVLRNFMFPTPSALQEVQQRLEAQYFDTGKGELTVMFENTKRVGSIPRGATRVHFLTLNFSASCDEDVKIDEINLKHVGLGNSADVRGVYLVKNFRRLTRSISFGKSKSTARLRLRNFIIPKCEAVKVDVLADMSVNAAVAGEHGITVASPRSIISSAKKNVFDHEPDSIRVVTTPISAGNIDVNFLPIRSRLRYGRLETVARIQLTADNESNHVLRSITLTNTGTARNFDLLRLFLETSSRQRVTLIASGMDREKVMLRFDPPFLLRRGITRLFLLKAEVQGSYKTVSFTLEEDGDLYAVPRRGR